jgi:MFS family permease
MRAAALAAAVGLVLADSSVVTLALPDVLREFDAEVSEVAWVLTAFNLVLALTAVPAARWSRRRSGLALGVGLVVFAGASALCAAAPTLGALVADRCAQALGGALVVTTALELLVREERSEQRAIALWGGAGVAGAAVGPAVGGILTGAFSWEAIFIVQVPIAIAIGVVLLVTRSRALGTDTTVAMAGGQGAAADGDRPHVPANLALLLVSAALTAALFLLVLLLIEGWQERPGVAGLAVSVMPVAALFAGLAARRLPDGRTRIQAGTIAIAGGLAALGLMPGSSLGWIVAPQVLIGAGLGLTVSALTQAALQGRSAPALHGGWTIAARHAGVVVGLLLLTPIFTSDLDQNADDARLAGTALLIDAPLRPLHKVDLGRSLGDQIRKADGRLPDIDPAFAANPPQPGEFAAQAKLRRQLQDQIDRGATHAFSTSFLIAALLALLALVPVLSSRGRFEL